MRFLLRQTGTELFLQFSGDWTNNRKTARKFISAAIAYWWAIEQKLFGVEVLQAQSEPGKDFVAMKVRKGTDRRAIVDCKDLEWRLAAHENLLNKIEVDLVNFEFDLHAKSCAIMAQAFNFEFTPDRDLQRKAAYLRKKDKPRLQCSG